MMGQTRQHNEKVAILVLGMHRSGTSAATRVLNLLGADLGSELLAPQADNQRGFWEHSRAVDIHERLLAGLGRSWHDIREMPAEWLHHPASTDASKEIDGLIGSDFADHALWAIKDPRMCRLVALWRRGLQVAGVQPAALIVVRDPRDVAQSLFVRDGWSPVRSYTMWAQHFLESYRGTKGLPRAILNYDDLLSDWRGSMARVMEALGVQWPRTLDGAEGEVTSFLNPGDQHHRASQGKVAEVAHQPPEALMELFHRACDIASGKADWSALEEIDKRYMEGSSIFAAPIEELVLERNELERLALERMDHINGLFHAKELIEERYKELDGIAGERLNVIQALEGEKQEGTIRLERAETRLKGQLAEIQELTSGQERLAQEVVRLSAEALRHSGESMRLSAEAVRHSGETVRLSAEAERLSMEAIRLAGELDQSEAAIVDLSGKNADLTAKITQLVNENAALSSDNGSLQLSQSALHDDLARREAEVAGAELRVAQITDQMRSKRWLLGQLLRRFARG